jgi:hypothetical protein
MAGHEPNDRAPSERPAPAPPVNRLAGRVRPYFDDEADAFTDEFFLEALRRDILLRRWRGAGPARRVAARPLLTAEDLHLHAWLNERLEAVRYERHGLWPRLRRLLLGDRLARWLGRLRRGGGGARARKG